MVTRRGLRLFRTAWPWWASGMCEIIKFKCGTRIKASARQSPFNIKEESLTLRNFTEEEVCELLDQHTEETGQVFASEAKAEIFQQTQGQPWLVNALASQLTTRWNALVPDRGQAVKREKVLEAREMLIERRDTHLDSLVDKLREERVKRVLEPILTGDISVETTYDDDFSYVRDVGLVTVREGVRQIANPMYQEIIPRVLTHQIQTAIPDKPAWFVAADGTLDLQKLINGFIQLILAEAWRGVAQRDDLS